MPPLRGSNPFQSYFYNDINPSDLKIALFYGDIIIEITPQA